MSKEALKLALEALGTMDVFNPNRMEAITALRQAIAEAEKQDKFCDNNCVWTDHHPDCKLGQSDRQELQAKGEHPAPCARFCEANAFQIEIRNLKAKLENQHPEWYHTKNIHGCDVFYHKTEERSYMFGQITPLYTTPPQRKPLTDEQTIILKNTTCPEIDWKARYFVEMNNGERNKWMLEWFIAFKVAIEEAHGIKE